MTKKIRTGVVAGLMAASLAVAPQAMAQDGGKGDTQSSISDLSSDRSGGKDGSGEGGSSNLDDNQKKILGGVLGGFAALALLAGLANFLQSQGGNFGINLPS